MEIIKFFDKSPFVSISNVPFEVYLLTPIGCFVYYDENYLFLNKGDVVILEENGKDYEIEEKVYNSYLKKWFYSLKFVV